jgi:hypothetical protein
MRDNNHNLDRSHEMKILVDSLKTFPNSISLVIENTVKKHNEFTEEAFREEFKATFPILYEGMTQEES